MRFDWRAGDGKRREFHNCGEAGWYKYPSGRSSLQVVTVDMTPKALDVHTKMRHPKGTSKIHRRYVTPGAELNTGVSELWPVHVRDARPIQDECKLDVCGFQLFQHKSKVS